MRRLAVRLAQSAGALLALAVLLAAAPPATANEEAQCRIGALPVPKQTEFPLLYSRRHDELTLAITYLVSSLPLHSALDLSAMYSFAPFDQRWHFGARIGATAGNWGADSRGPLGLSLGARSAYDFTRPLSGVIDIYAFVQADGVFLASRGDPVLRLGAGLGVRAMRTIGLELSFDPLISLGAPFVGQDRVASGMGFGVSYDFCSMGAGCNERPQKSIDLDLTQRLYQTATGIVPADAGQREALCKAVQLALDPTKYRPHDSIDSTGAFLKGIVDNLNDPALKSSAQSLVDSHVAFRKQLIRSREYSRWAAAADTSLEVHCEYSPFPVEIREALSCSPARP